MDDLEFKGGGKDSGPLTEHVLRGEIRRVVYCSDDETYTVMRVTDDSGREQTAVGAISGAYEGQGIELRGSWESHKEHGRQFRAKSYRFILPSTPDGIKKYLASGLIPGIGPKFADAIVSHFGAKTLDVLDNYSSRLLEVPGFGRKRLESIRKAWSEYASKREIFIYMQSLGISQAYCQRIYSTYGERTPAVLKENPYQAAEDVDGIGFVLADRIAGGLGISKNHEARLCAGTVYSLNRLSEAGHVCYPEEEFLKLTANLLGVDDGDALKGLEAAVAKELAIREDFTAEGGMKMVYSAPLNRCEKELAALVAGLAGVKAHRGSGMAHAEIQGGRLSFNDEQAQAIRNAAEHPLSIITGGPGVGKTTVVSEIVRRARAAKLKIFLVAPTGRASKRLSESCRCPAMTIHRLLRWDPGRKRFAYSAKYPLPCDVIVADETSMLDLPLAVYLLRAVARGTTVVMVGDADQLPSVGPGNFLNDMIRSGRFAVTKLTRIYRQAEGSRIITNAHAVNRGEMPDLSPVPKDRLSDFYWIDEDMPEKVVGIVSEMVTQRIPKRFGLDPLRDIQVITPMNKGSCGTETLNRTLQNSVNPPAKGRPQFNFGEQTFRSGDKIMQTLNNYDKGVFNGDIGRIASVSYEEKKFKVLFDGDAVEYDFAEAAQIALAYAVTVHKSQGSEFPAIVVPVLTQHFVMLQRNLIYTAMTRAKKLLVMVGTRKALAIAVKNIRIEPRYSMLVERIAKLCPTMKNTCPYGSTSRSSGGRSSGCSLSLP